MSDFPALYDCTTRSLSPVGGAGLFTVGCAPDAGLPLTDDRCARYHFRLLLEAHRYHVEALSRNHPTYLNGQVLLRRTPLLHGAELRAGNSAFRYLERADPAFAPAPPAVRPPLPPSAVPMPPTPALRAPAPVPRAPAPPAPAQPAAPPPPAPSWPAATAPTVRAAVAPPLVGGSAPGATVLAGTPSEEELPPIPDTIPLAGTVVIGRETGRVDVVLQHPHVSRMHAQLARQGNTAIVSDLRSANGTFVNGQRVRAPVQVRPGDRIDVGPYSLVFTGDALVPQSRENNVELIGRRLTRVVSDRATGKPRSLLDDVSLVIRPHEFVCLLGPSGAGKSTLLSALSGRGPARGSVLLNGKELYANFESLKRDLVVVAQKDVLHDCLTVERAIWYTAKLRLPPDTREAEIQDYIDQMLTTVGLTAQRGTPIASLSGGQIKRTSLANELLSKPTLLFLDEVTSGLDEQTDREMMALFNSLARAGKTVVCVTHSLANVEQNCHLVVILANGGKLAFVGKPAEALTYFGIARRGDVYEKLSERPALEWQEGFLRTTYHEQYVASRLPPEIEADTAPAEETPRRLAQKARDATRQAVLLTRRYLDITLADRRALVVMMGQAILVAVLLVLVFGNLKDQENPVEHARRSLMLLFLMEISCFWFGCNNAAKEVVKERVVYARERDFNLNISSYYASKFVLLSLLTVLQVASTWAIVEVWCRPSGNMGGALVFLATMGIAGVALGLAASCFASSSDVAVSLIPIALIPQIILAGVISTLEGVSLRLAQGLITCYWGNRGLVALLPDSVLANTGVERLAVWKSYPVVVLHAAVFVLAGLAVLSWQDRRKRKS